MLDTLFRHILAEVDDVGLELAAATRTVDDRERRCIVDHRIRIRGHGNPADRLRPLEKARIRGFQKVGKRGAGHGESAVQADHLCVRPVQVDHLGAARLGVQKVDVLSDQPGHHACAFQCRECAMPGIGQRLVHMPPTDMITGPVPLPKLPVAGELPNGHRGARRRIGPAVVGNPGIRGHPRARQHCNPATPQQGDELRCVHPVQGSSAGGLLLIVIVLRELCRRAFVLIAFILLVVVLVLVDEDRLDYLDVLFGARVIR